MRYYSSVCAIGHTRWARYIYVTIKEVKLIIQLGTSSRETFILNTEVRPALVPDVLVPPCQDPWNSAIASGSMPIVSKGQQIVVRHGNIAGWRLRESGDGGHLTNRKRDDCCAAIKTQYVPQEGPKTLNSVELFGNISNQIRITQQRKILKHNTATTQEALRGQSACVQYISVDFRPHTCTTIQLIDSGYDKVENRQLE